MCDISELQWTVLLEVDRIYTILTVQSSSFFVLLSNTEIKICWENWKTVQKEAPIFAAIFRLHIRVSVTHNFFGVDDSDISTLPPPPTKYLYESKKWKKNVKESN